MLLAIEGGGFFSSSASGYFKGIALLLLGRKTEEKPMRVSPWNHYHLVNQQGDPNLQLASWKNKVSRSCAYLVSFNRSSAGKESLSPPKVGPIQQPGLKDDKNVREISLKSSLKKPSPCEVVSDNGDLPKSLSEKDSDIPDSDKRKKVQWTDVCGGELIEIREFELSVTGSSDEEFEGDNDQSCSCVIM